MSRTGLYAKAFETAWRHEKLRRKVNGTLDLANNIIEAGSNEEIL
jgi:hypothetical protein